MMMVCDPKAQARCKDRDLCGDHCFKEGSDCDKFNQKVLADKPTNADRIRGMSDEELLQFIAAVFCSGMVAEERGNDFNHSFVWTLDWLRQHAEKEAHQ